MARRSRPCIRVTVGRYTRCHLRRREGGTKSVRRSVKRAAAPGQPCPVWPKLASHIARSRRGGVPRAVACPAAATCSKGRREKPRRHVCLPVRLLGPRGTGNGTL